MDKVQKYNSFNTNTPSSESYRKNFVVFTVFKELKKDRHGLPERVYLAEGFMFFQFQISLFHKVSLAICVFFSHAPAKYSYEVDSIGVTSR